MLRGSESESARRERNLSRLLIAFIGSGLAFMLLPGTFLGLWNLFAISSHRSAQSVSDAWVQAHGHAQVFGWIGCFILGIGFHSIPKMTGASSRVALGKAIFCLSAWVSGVTLRWFANVYLWHWRTLPPISAVLELVAFAVFYRAVSQHKPSTTGKSKLEPWIFVVIAGTLGWLATLLVNLYGCIHAALYGNNPAFPFGFDQRFLVLMAWGFLVPHVWGFSAKWLPIFLGLKPVRERMLLGAIAINVTGIILAAFGVPIVATISLAVGAAVASTALRIFEPTERPAKTNGVHASFPLFIRLSYVWLHIASLLAIWAATSSNASGIWGASRHALTVGFISAMVFCIGQRVLPAFSGMKLLWSPRLMFADCALLVLGCTLRVGSEVLAYQSFSVHAWKLLPVSAVVEMTAVTLFALNLVFTFIQSPAHQVRLREEAAASARAAVS
jgi:hypothetical protein